jgi:prephenate dehydrogenase
MHVDTLAIIGVGLIGGSIAAAAKRRGVARRVIGAGRRRDNLDRAVSLGILDEAHLDPAQATRNAELVVFCTPVDHIPEQALAVADHCSPGVVFTDAGSTKAEIVRELEDRLPPGVPFVGGHPLAGSEKRGCEHADADLFQDRLTILTPTARTDPAALERVAAFWRALGARVRLMDPQEHDEALALTSHLPHLSAAALAGVLPADLHDLTATGYRDTTRVAAGDPSIWVGILVQNRVCVLNALKQLEQRLARFRTALAAGDASTLDTLLREGKEVRDALGS